MSQEPTLPPGYTDAQRRSSLVSYLLLIGLSVCASLSWMQLVQWILPAWNWTPSPTELPRTFLARWDLLPYLVFLVCAEAIFTRSIASRLEGRERIIYHFAEWVTIAIVLKIAVYFAHGFELLLQDLPRWQSNFLTFFEGEYFFWLIPCALLWFFCRLGAEDIDQLQIDETDLDWDLGKLQASRTTIRATLVGRILWTGILMVILASGTRFAAASLGSEAVLQQPVIAIMLYFFLALMLFGQTQFALLSGRWIWHRASVPARIGRRWLQYSLLFFMVISLIAFALPTGYTLGLLETLNIALAVLMTVGAVIIQVLFAPFFLLLNLVGCTRQSSSSQPENEPPVSLMPQVPASPALPWLEVLKSVLFWTFFLAVILFSLFQFIRQNPQLLAILQGSSIVQKLGSFLAWLGSFFKQAGQQARQFVTKISERLPFRSLRTTAPRALLDNFRTMDARQRIIFYYLRLLERGQKHGLKLKTGQTPAQYAATLQTGLPEVNEEIAGFTDTFLEARYSQHPITLEQANLVQRLWRSITRSLEHRFPR